MVENIPNKVKVFIISVINSLLYLGHFPGKDKTYFDSYYKLINLISIL